jgi:non-ribosomal peptide synthetase-like protein
MANTEYSSTSFRIDPIEIGEKSYLGNNILYPAGAKTGRNVLLATKVMVPIDGPVREDVGLLGSPSFEIPRAAACDLEGAAMSEASRKEGVRIKNYHNLGTICWYLFANWTFLFSALLTGYIALNAYWQVGLLALWAYALFMLLFSVGYWVLVERASVGFGRLEAKTVGLYDRYFLYHERHWKFCANPLVQAFAGTPLKNLISWLLGVKIGRRIFDDGANIYDKTLIEIGDYANLNAGCVLQGHSLEEGIFKSGHVKIGAACSIASGAFVHYGVDMGESVTLGSNAFLMKGETPPPDTVWEGNPAKLAEEASCIVAAPCTTAAAIAEAA